MSQEPNEAENKRIATTRRIVKNDNEKTNAASLHHEPYSKGRWMEINNAPEVCVEK